MNDKRILLCAEDGELLFWGYSAAARESSAPPPDVESGEPSEATSRHPVESGIFAKAKPVDEAAPPLSAQQR